MTQISDEQYPKVYSDYGAGWRAEPYYSVVFSPGGRVYWPIRGVFTELPIEVTEETIGKTELIFERPVTDPAEVRALLRQWSGWRCRPC